MPNFIQIFCIWIKRIVLSFVVKYVAKKSRQQQLLPAKPKNN